MLIVQLLLLCLLRLVDAEFDIWPIAPSNASVLPPIVLDPLLTTQEVETYWQQQVATIASVDISRISHSVLPGTSNNQKINAHISVIRNPFAHVSVLPPVGDCNGTRSLTSDVAAAAYDHSGCILATNAGLFNVSTGNCLGSVVSDQMVIARDHVHHNVHFGVTSSGHYFVGYPDTLDDIYFNRTRPVPSSLNETYPWHFEQLVGGVLWLIRNGTNYLSTSLKEEDPSTQATGSLLQFASILSARTMFVKLFCCSFSSPSSPSGVNESLRTSLHLPLTTLCF